MLFSAGSCRTKAAAMPYRGPGLRSSTRPTQQALIINARQATPVTGQDGSKSIKVAGQQVPTAAQFTAPVKQVQQMLRTGHIVTEQTPGVSDAISEGIALVAQAAAELSHIRQTALEQQEMMDAYEQLLAGLAADYKDMLVRQVATKQVVERQTSSQMQALQSNNHSMSLKLQALQAKFAEQRAQLEAMQQEKQGYKQQLRVAVAEAEDLKQQMTDKAAAQAEEVEAMRQQNADLQAQLAAMQTQLASAVNDKAALAQELDAAKGAAAAAAEEAAQQAAVAAMSQLSLHAKVTNLEAQLAASRQTQETLLAENEALQEDLQQARATAQELRDSNTDLSGQVQVLEGQHTQQVAHIAALQDEKAALSAELKTTGLELHDLQQSEEKLLSRNQQLTDLVDQQQVWISPGSFSHSSADPWHDADSTSSSSSSSPVKRALSSVQVYTGYQAYAAAPPVVDDGVAPSALSVHTTTATGNCKSKAAAVASGKAEVRKEGGDELLVGAWLALSVVIPLLCQHNGLW